MASKQKVSVLSFLDRHLKNRKVGNYPRLMMRKKWMRPLLLAQACQAEVILEGRQPFYSIDHDVVVVPPPSFYRSFLVFKSPSRFAVDVLHELVHWTGAPSRLNRNRHQERGDTIYCQEELRAELGAAILATEIGVARTLRLPHARYLEGWLSVLPSPEAELSAALTGANRAVGYILALAKKEMV